jgi:hypothetical protein
MKTTGSDPEDVHGKSRCVLQGKDTDRATLAAIAHQAMIERNLEPDFPPAVLQELTTIGGPAGATDDVRDVRDQLWASIDNDDSRDLDQLTVAESLEGGRFRILVAVADVDALVRKGSAIDGHASRNTTSASRTASGSGSWSCGTATARSASRRSRRRRSSTATSFPISIWIERTGRRS